MHNQIILTPFFLDEPLPELENLAAPAMNYPAAGGPSAKELQTVMKHLNGMEKIAAVSVSSWNPAMDKDGRSRKVCMELLNTLIND